MHLSINSNNIAVFLKADPEMEIRVQVIYYGSASRRTWSGRGKQDRDGEEAKSECSLSRVKSSSSLLPQGNSGV